MGKIGKNDLKIQQGRFKLDKERLSDDKNHEAVD